MKIALIVPGFSADEQDWCIPALRNLTGELARTDEVVVIALRYPHRAARYTAFGTRVIALGGARAQGVGSARLWQRTLAAIRAEHRRRPFDVLHAFWATETGMLAAVAGRLLRIPSIVSLAGGELAALRDIGYGDQLAATQRPKIALALRLATHVTGGSPALLDLAAPHLRRRPAATIHHRPLGLDTTIFRPLDPLPLTPYPFRLITAASLVPVKDQAMLLRALASLHAQGHAATLTIAGSGPEEAHLRAIATTLSLADHVTFLGTVPHNRLPDLYRQHDLFVLTSRHEAQGMAPLEAAACGLPLVGTAVGVLPALAPAARTVPIGDHTALATALAATLTDPARLATMREAAYILATTRYNLAHTTAQFRALYRHAATD